MAESDHELVDNEDSEPKPLLPPLQEQKSTGSWVNGQEIVAVQAYAPLPLALPHGPELVNPFAETKCSTY